MGGEAVAFGSEVTYGKLRAAFPRLGKMVESN